jgi:hypothetical protein
MGAGRAESFVIQCNGSRICRVAASAKSETFDSTTKAYIEHECQLQTGVLDTLVQAMLITARSGWQAIAEPRAYIDHTDDYPSWKISFEASENQWIALNQSNARMNLFWNVQELGRWYKLDSDAFHRSFVAAIMPIQHLLGRQCPWN